MRRLAVAAALGVTLGACGGASAPEPPPPFDPTGTYDITIDAQDMTIGGTLTFRGGLDALTGSIDTDMGSAALADIVLTDREMTFAVPDVDVTFRVVFAGDGLAGDFDGAMASGTIVGTKVPAGSAPAG